jgi:hypothetical protein
VAPERARIKAETGRYPKRLDFDITLEMTLGSDKGVLLVEAKQGRKKLGMASIEYDHDPADRGILVSSED